MNWLLLIAAIVLIWRIAEGFHRGMVKEIISFVSLVVLCIAILLIGTALSKYFKKDIVSMAVAIILLLVLCIVHRLLSLVFFSAKVVSKLPVVHATDKVLGAVIGVLETVLFIWTVFSLIIVFDFGIIGKQILEYAASSQILVALYQYNYLLHFVEFFADKLHIAQVIL
ncbi:MAG TPA: CvpA family protein [Lachnospiraceae bacterium]|nr:CvpA family protein [Lachnospiraceae bacterium]